MADILVSVPIGPDLVGAVGHGPERHLVVALETQIEHGSVVSGEEPAAFLVRSADRDVWIVGGRLPAGAITAWARDARGDLVEGRAAAGAWVAAVAQPRIARAPPVLFRDAAGAPVPRAPDGDLDRVTDTAMPCPACEAVDWGCRPSGDELVCRACGHRESVGVFYGGPVDDAEEADPAAEAAWRAEHRRRELRILEGLDFPLFELDDRWAGGRALGGWGGPGRDDVDRVTVRHRQDEATLVDVECSVGKRWEDALEAALRSVLANVDEAPWPDASRAAVTLWLRARERAVIARIAGATQGALTLAVDGRPQSFELLDAGAGAWAATARIGDVAVTVAAAGTGPETIGLRRVRDLGSLVSDG